MIKCRFNRVTRNDLKMQSMVGSLVDGQITFERSANVPFIFRMGLGMLKMGDTSKKESVTVVRMRNSSRPIA